MAQGIAKLTSVVAFLPSMLAQDLTLEGYRRTPGQPSVVTLGSRHAHRSSVGRVAVSLDDVRSLLDAPSPAALVTYRADGSADVSPVWYRCTDSAFEVVIAADDPKLRRIAVDDRAVLTVFETVTPFRGVKVAGRVMPDRDPAVVREAREAIASRYLGETRGAAFVESRGPGVVIRLPVASARAWDLEAALPPTYDQGA